MPNQEEAFSRTGMLLGADAVRRLQQSRVAVFGLGGVGSYAAEALARTGVGALVLVDHDTVSPSNLNRQILALHSTLGRKKAEVMRERLLDINPGLLVSAHDCFYLPGNDNRLLDGCDYIVDAIDTVSAKIALVEAARERGIPIISCMGTGNKTDPTRLEVADLAETSVCPLCRVMRRELRKRGIPHLRVVYSREEPHRTASAGQSGKAPAPGSLMCVTASAGLLLASEAIRTLTRKVQSAQAPSAE